MLHCAEGGAEASCSVVVVDDHPCLRSGLKSAIASSPHLRVVGEAADGPEALAVVRHHRPDVVVLDLLLPHLNGLDVMRTLRSELPQVKFVAFSMREEAWFVRETLGAGAARYVSKKSSPSELVLAIEQTAVARAPLVGSEPEVDAPADAPSAEALRLSRREGETLRLLARGMRVKDAAQLLDVGARTLETYKARAMQKLQLRSRADLLRFAEHSGWLDDGP